MSKSKIWGYTGVFVLGFLSSYIAQYVFNKLNSDKTITSQSCGCGTCGKRTY